MQCVACQARQETDSLLTLSMQCMISQARQETDSLLTLSMQCESSNLAIMLKVVLVRVSFSALTLLVIYITCICVVSQWQVHSLQWVYLSLTLSRSTATQSLLRSTICDFVCRCRWRVTSLVLFSRHSLQQSTASSPSTGTLCIYIYM